jgi:dipeptidase E
MKEAWEAGIALAGLSAGAMCWFQGGISMSGGAPEAVVGLGLLAESLSVHRNSEPQRLPAYRQAVAAGELPGGYAADDETALLFAGSHLVDCVASRTGRGILRVEADDGRAVECPMPVRLLTTRVGSPALDGVGHPDAESDRIAVEEMRSVRALRSRWG